MGLRILFGKKSKDLRCDICDHVGPSVRVCLDAVKRCKSCIRRLKQKEMYDDDIHDIDAAATDRARTGNNG